MGTQGWRQLKTGSQRTQRRNVSSDSLICDAQLICELTRKESAKMRRWGRKANRNFTYGLSFRPTGLLIIQPSNPPELAYKKINPIVSNSSKNLNKEFSMKSMLIDKWNEI